MYICTCVSNKCAKKKMWKCQRNLGKYLKLKNKLKIKKIIISIQIHIYN